jgi:small ligand-binding sensory domain FIST
MASPRSCRVGVGLSTLETGPAAAAEAADAAREEIGRDTPVDLAYVFLASAHLDDAAEAAGTVREVLDPRVLVGCVADGVVARNRELERGPAVAVWAGALPGAEIECFHLTADRTEDGIHVSGTPELGPEAIVTLLADPFTFPTDAWLASLNVTPGRPAVVGGITIGVRQPGAQALIADGDVHTSGALGVAVAGPQVLTVVSQGCRPIGHEAVVTRCEENTVFELAGMPALERLRQDLAAASPEEQALAARGVLVGLVIDENRPEYETDDFLMRGLLGAHQGSGALVIGDMVRVGQTMRFFVRDAASADADLRRTVTAALEGRTPAGALLFTCNGRGTNMFAQPDHDAKVVADILGTDALAGFFCGGEIGPVGGKAFLHGFTATVAIFLR